MQKTAFVNIDLDFFSKPVYSGCSYIEKDYLSPNQYRSQAKTWMRTDAVISDILFDKKIRGASFASDKQIISHLNKVKRESIIEEQYTLVNIDAHLDLFPFYAPDQYINKGVYSNQDWLIYPFYEKLIREAVWVHPNLTDDELKKQIKNLHFKHHYDDRMRRLEVFSEISNMTIWFISWSDLMIQNYDIKYLTLTLNSHMTTINSDSLEPLRKRIKEY